MEAEGCGWRISVVSPPDTDGRASTCDYYVAIADSVLAVEAVKKTRGVKPASKLLVKHQLSGSDLAALRVKPGRVRLVHREKATGGSSGEQANAGVEGVARNDPASSA